MKYDYIEIGTSDFDLLSVKYPGKKGISVEPVRTYFDRLPKVEGNTKVHAAISYEYRLCYVYYIPPEVIKREGLPNWVRGCNSIDVPHPTVQRLLKGRFDELVIKDEVECLTWEGLAECFDITGVDKIKIDTEGHEYQILTGLFEFCRDFEARPLEIVFEFNQLSDEQDMKAVILKFNSLGYEGDFITRNDYKLSYEDNNVAEVEDESADTSPEIDACWEGSITVGGGCGFSGWMDGDFGSIVDSPMQTCNEWQIFGVYWSTSHGGQLILGVIGDGVVNKIELNGKVYDMGGRSYLRHSGPNPFPPVGETCLIRILS